MEIIKTNLDGAYIIYPTIYSDDRGCFFESYRSSVLEENGIPTSFVQDNESYSQYGVIRGLHYQAGDFAQGKLVRVVSGEVLDVIVDIRKDSATYGKHISVILNDVAKKQLYIPPGFAHGFAVLSPSAVFSYKCTEYYHPEAEYGILYNDAELGIDWAIPEGDRIVSEKDFKLPAFNNHHPIK